MEPLSFKTACLNFMIKQGSLNQLFVQSVGRDSVEPGKAEQENTDRFRGEASTRRRQLVSES